ncbi:hypothetical protein BDA99DRAFT_110383 [Phascolomyces articulosus]|uniref:Uncharacterized protein n=1 Tax=Phascolomyces articulosus TaxID=60185 RepID=A0AAD5K660_9FUNG|nr:hypothetical protein BDA99DRAFT_110383 [Phascolomyces articulosus]
MSNIQPLTISDIKRDTFIFEHDINNTIENHRNFREEYNNLLNKGPVPSDEENSDTQFKSKKEEHYAFEHHLREMRLRLSMYEFEVIETLPPWEPNYPYAIDRISSLLHKIRQYLSDSSSTHCPRHEQNQNAYDLVFSAMYFFFHNLYTCKIIVII